MIARGIGICKPTRLPLALANRLSHSEQDELADHLADCAHCRAELERLAGEGFWWDEAKQFLNADESSDEVVLVRAGDQKTVASLTADEDEAPNYLELLDPTDKPAMLGRLGEYEVEAVVGCGGMGVVFTAHDPQLNRRVAIKVLAHRLAASAAARKRFAREAQAAAAIVHDHVVPIYSIHTASRTPFLVMPYITGQSLQDRLDACGTLEVGEVLRIAMQAARGLAAAHAQGLVHRDIKPANILLENGLERVRITDFGLARAIDDASQTQSGFITGTPQYMAPEQARGELVDQRADLFSLGSVMFAMCAGYPPFRAETTLAVLRRICDDAPRNLREINPEIPDWLAQIVEKLLAKNSHERFQSAREVADLLEAWLAHLRQPTLVAPPAMIRPKQIKKRPMATIALAAGVASCIVGWSIWAALSPEPEPMPAPKSPAVRQTSADRNDDSSIAMRLDQFDRELAIARKETAQLEDQHLLDARPLTPGEEMQTLEARLQALERELVPVQKQLTTDH